MCIYTMSMASLLILVYLVLSFASVSRVLGKLECQETANPVSPSDSGHMLMTASADEARNTAVCHAICIKYIFESQGSPNGSNGTAATKGAGLDGGSGSSMMEIKTEGLFQLNCTQFKQYLDCRSGCIAQSEGQTCPGICSGRCQGICGSNLDCFSPSVENNDCGVNCKESDCSQGCQRFSQLPSSVLPKPMNAPVLTRVVDNQQIYDVSIPIEIELQVYDNPSLVFRIEDSSQPGEYVYQWMVDVVFDLPEITMMEYLLDLASYSGRSLNISYAFVTSMGLSEYAESATIQVPDQCVVVALTQSEVDISASLDERAGFFTHYVLNVSWCPTTCTEQVSHFVVTRNPSGNPGDGYCGEIVNVTAHATSSSVILKSNDPITLNLPCTQRVQVQTVLVDGTTQEVSKSICLSTVGDVADFPELEFVGCPARYDRQNETYIVDFQWSVPFSPAALSHIELMLIRADRLLRLEDEFNNSKARVFSDNVPVNPNFDDILYNITTQLPPLKDKDEFYELGIDVRWMAPAGPDRSDNCRPVGTFAPPPFPIQVINVTSIETVSIRDVNDEAQDVIVSASVQWETPELQYPGNITRYEIHLGKKALQPDKEKKNIDIITNDDGLQNNTVRRTFLNIPVERLIVKGFLQIRSRQFEDFSSNWSEAKEIDFVVLRQPDPVEDLTINFTTVDIVCRNNQTFLELDVGATWSKASVPKGITVDYYKFRINNVQIITKTVSVDLTLPLIALDPGKPFLDLNFQIRVVVSFRGEIQESLDSLVNETFVPLPYPENIFVVAKNPRLKQLKSSDMLNMSVELSLDWDQPQSQLITSYEIYTTSNSSFVCVYDRFGERVGTVVDGSLTKFSQTFSAVVADQDTPMLVLMRSLVDGDIHQLPQWSQPISLTPSTLPPPEINSSSLLSISVTSDPSNSDSFSVSTTVEVSWEEPETDDLKMYEVWVGGRALGEFEQPEESDVFGSILQFQVHSTSAATTGLITETFSTTFSSDSENVSVHIQVRSVGPNGIPKWSTPSDLTDRGGVQANGTGNNSYLTIILSAAVPIVLILLIIAIGTVTILIYCNKQKYKEMRDRDCVHVRSIVIPIFDEWEIPTDDVIFEQLLGEGAFGEVYKGVIRGPLENPKISAVLRQAIDVPVTIKLLNQSSAGKEKADFLAEIDMMKKIAEGYNTHIVNMVGCVTLKEPLCLITEFVPYGDLLSYLKYQRKKCSEARRREKLQQQQQEVPTTNDGYELENGYQPAPFLEPGTAYSHLEPKNEPEEEDNSGYKDLGDIEPDDLIRFAYQIASGMEYLASLKIVHRDLACRNVLIAKDKLLKISDFSLSQEVYVKKTRGRLPLKWMAIESITAREFTTASDVWAFGVTLYEIGTIGGFPYPSINNEDLLRMLSQGYRLEKPDNYSAEVYDLMLKCWEEEPMDRPSFSQLRTSFSAMLQAGSADEYIDLQVNEEAPYYQIKDDELRKRSDLTGSASADSADEYIDLQVNEEAPYYQIKDDELGKRSDSTGSASSDGSISSTDKKKKPKEKVKRTVTNPYIPTPEQAQQGQQGEGDDEAMVSAGSVQERPVQLGIPISQLVPAVSSSENAEHQLTPVDEATPHDDTPLNVRATNPYVQEPSEAIDDSLIAASIPMTVTSSSAHSEDVHQLTPIDEAAPQDDTPLEPPRMTNPYVQEPSEAIDESVVAVSMPVTVASSGAHSEGMRESALDPSELVESTHL